MPTRSQHMLNCCQVLTRLTKPGSTSTERATLTCSMRSVSRTHNLSCYFRQAICLKVCVRTWSAWLEYTHFHSSGASFNNWLDAVDGSFCTFEGGDDPEQVYNLATSFMIRRSYFWLGRYLS